MPYSWTIKNKKYPLLNGVIFCVCDILADGLYRGSRFDYESNKTFPLNRWLCEQCAWTIVEDGNKIKRIKRQILTEDQWLEFDRWYDDNCSI